MPPSPPSNPVWPDGETAPKWLWPCEHGDEAHPLVESHPVPAHHTCAECGVKPVPVIPLSVAEELAGALERITKNALHIFDRKPVRDWDETLHEANAALTHFNTIKGASE